MYREVLRPALFALPPGAAHAAAFLALAPAEYLAPVRALLRAAVWRPHDQRLAVRAMGLTFTSPLGLASGFDKNARRTRSLSALDFGHLEVGTVTARPQSANPSPNLFRLPADHALVNRLGFPNEGAERVAKRLARVRSAVRAPIGVSIGKSRSVPVNDLTAVIADYVESLDRVDAVADFVVINVSSPNTPGLREMQARDHLSELLMTLRARARHTKSRLLVKIAPDLDDHQLDEVLSVVEQVGMAGVVATNTTVQREGLASDPSLVQAIGVGGLSGAPLRTRALQVVARVRARLGPTAVVIGVGGVDRAEHVLAFMRAGADLVQMYTGFVFQGPGAPARIVRGLDEMLSREGASSIAQLVSRSA